MKNIYTFSQKSRMYFDLFLIGSLCVMWVAYFTGIETQMLFLCAAIAFSFWFPFEIYNFNKIKYVSSQTHLRIEKYNLLLKKQNIQELFYSDILCIKRDFIINWKNPGMNIYKIYLNNGKRVLIPSGLENHRELMEEIVKHATEAEVDDEIKGYINTGKPVKPKSYFK